MRMTTLGRWRIAAVASLFGLGLLHCTFGDLDGLGAGSTDAAVPQESGGEVLGDVASSDAGDASTGDTGTARDTGSRDADASSDVADSGTRDGTGSGVDAADAAPDGPWVPASAPPTWLAAGSQSWCTMHDYGWTFCADFDEGPLPALFSASDGPYLAATSSSAESDSLANDLLLYIPPQSGTQTFGSKLSRQFETYASTITLAFDIMPEYINQTTSGILFAALDFTEKAAPAAYSLRLAYNEGAPRLEESFLGDGPADIYHTNFTLPPGVWSHVQVVITFAGGDGGSADAGSPTEVISVGGVPQGLPEVLTPPPGFDSRPNLLIGAVYGTNPTNGWAIRYDNVVLTLQ
jgi:hypothetical protein